VLNADFGRLADQVREAEAAGVDLIHVDVMDGLFVPNLSLGFPVLEAIRRATALPLDVHLMIERPERYVADFASAGANLLTVHQEATVHLHRTVAEIKQSGLQAGVALCPATPLAVVRELAGEIDLLLIMTIDPGFGGQALIPSMLDKVSRARALLDDGGSAAALEVDGGVKAHNAKGLVNAGADTLVVGTGIFHCPRGIRAGVEELRAAIGAGGA
jgi:ribulose-phosphate 3-epimerase